MVIRKQAPELPTTESLLCRDLRHAWLPNGDLILTEQKGQVRTFRRYLECGRCGTIRRDTYRISTRTLERVSSTYGYTKGYTVPGGLSMAEARFALFAEAPMVTEDGIPAPRRLKAV